MRQKRTKDQSLKDDGLWIQCCKKKCQKWRFVTEYVDPVSVPRIWVCSDNVDKKFSSCDIPEEETNDVLIESKYNLGTIVWTKMKGYPWWPGIIDNCPNTQEFYKLDDSNVPVKYHVTFLQEEVVKYMWVEPNNIKPFKKNDGQQPMKRAKMVYAEKDYTDLLRIPLEMAKSAITFDVPERLKKYSVSSRMKQSKEDLQVAIPQNTEKKVRPFKRPKRNLGGIKYVSTNIERVQNEKENKSRKYNLKEQKKVLPASDKNKQVTLRSSIFALNQTVIGSHWWNLCSIQ